MIKYIKGEMQIMMPKKLASLFLASTLTVQLSPVFAVPPHAAPPGEEEKKILRSIEEELRKPGEPSWLWSWFEPLFGGKKETLDIENCPFKDYIPFFYTIFTAHRILGCGNIPDQLRNAETEAALRSAKNQLYLILYATRLPEELTPEKFQEYSDQIERIRSIVCHPDSPGSGLAMKVRLLGEIKDFLNKFSTHLSEEKIGFRELSTNRYASYNYASASVKNAPKLVTHYFGRVKDAHRPRVLIVGNGRAVAKKVFMDRLVSDPSDKRQYDTMACQFGYYHDIAWGGTPCDEKYYGDSKYDYFLVDIEPDVRPDVCLDMEHPASSAILGENQWDIVLFEGFYSKQAANVAKKLLKPDGILLGNFTELKDGTKLPAYRPTEADSLTCLDHRQFGILYHRGA